MAGVFSARAFVAVSLTFALAGACASGEQDVTPGQGGSGGSSGVAGGDASSDGTGGSAGGGGAGGSAAGGGAGGAGGGSGGAAGGGASGSAGQAGADAAAGNGGAGGSSGASGPNESCPGEVLTLSGAPTLTATVSTGTPPKDDAEGSCGGGGGAREAVYRFTAPVSGIATVMVSSTAFDGVAYVRSTCADALSEIDCQDAQGTNGTETITFFANAGAEYFIFADGKNVSAAGLFAVQVELAPAQPVDGCPGETVTWTGSGAQDRTASVSGNTSGLWSSDTASCSSGSSAAKDGVYSLTPDVNGILTVELVPNGWDATLSLRSTCAVASSELACAENEPLGGKETVEVWATNGNTVHAMVDGASASSSGAYTLNAVLSPEKQDEKCPGETATLTGTNPMTWSMSGDTSKRWPDLTLGCAAGAGSSTARDVVYALTPPATGLLSLKVTPIFWDAILSIRTSCSGGAEVCADAFGVSSIDTHDFVAQGGQTYYLIVDGKSAAGAGAYTLEASLVPFPEADGCPGKLLTASGGTAQASDDLSTFYADFTSSCAPVTSAKDAVYRIVAPMTGTMNVALLPSGWDAAVYVDTTCAPQAPYLACNDSNPAGGGEYAAVPVTQGTTYWVFVDSANAAGGTFTLTLSFL